MFLKLTLLFFIGCFGGWIMEFFFRRIVHKKWCNPGFLTGPWLPIYGTGLCALYLLCRIPLPFIHNAVWEAVVRILLITVTMTAIEYVTGMIFIVGMKVKLWDYSNRWGNVHGVICPLFSLIWGVIGGAYAVLIDPEIVGILNWFSDNLAYSFVVGTVFGVFLVDVCYSFGVVSKIRTWAVEKNVVVKYEELKTAFAEKKRAALEKLTFLLPFRSKRGIKEDMNEYLADEETEEKSVWHKAMRKK